LNIKKVAMGLDFTSIPDKEGSALYIIHNPSVTEERRFEELKKEINQSSPEAQVVLLDISTADAEQVRDFYDIMPESIPTAFIIADDDTLQHQWYGEDIPSADVICYHLSQING
jgi:3-deoxy-D-manno-octulosonic-acid transferase